MKRKIFLSIKNKNFNLFFGKNFFYYYYYKYNIKFFN